MRTAGDWVMLVCFVSLISLGWWVLVYGFAWPVAFAGLWWLIIGLVAASLPNDGRRKQ